MEKGSLRCDVNISVHPRRALAHEGRDQEPELASRTSQRRSSTRSRADRGYEAAIRESRAGDAPLRSAKGETRTMRRKRTRTIPLLPRARSAADHDLERRCSSARRALPEVPAARRERYRTKTDCRRTTRECCATRARSPSLRDGRAPFGQAEGSGELDRERAPAQPERRDLRLTRSIRCRSSRSTWPS
jgi:Asp-tRNA(Asn)/Glu-tRNA(Gln) amidotransferase B subunit